jgi:hypothetical protein
MSFKCSPDDFAELIERPGLRPAPYLARAKWLQEEALGETLDRRELERLLRASYDLVAAKLPGSKRPTKPRARTLPAHESRQRKRAPAATRRRRKPTRWSGPLQRARWQNLRTALFDGAAITARF